MNKKIIVLSANSTWYLYNFRRKMIHDFQKDGYQVVVVAPKDSYSDMFNELGVKTYSLYMDQKGKNPINDLRTFFNYIRLYKRIKPDIVLNYTIKANIYGTLAASLLSIPIINNIAGLGTLFIKNNIFTKLAIFLYRISQKRADIVIFQNNDDKELFVKYKLVNKDQIDRVPGSGVDLIRFKPSVLREKNEKFTFLLVARMLREKGVEVLVEAGKLLNEKGYNFEINFLGFLDVENPGAITKTEMDNWCELSYINYLGVSNSVEDVIDTSDCVVLPSYYREGIPRTLLEAAAMAKPIITTDNVGCKEVVEHEKNGYKCKTKSIVDLSIVMERMLNVSNKEYNDMCIYSRKKMENEFDENIVINTYKKHIKTILS